MFRHRGAGGGGYTATDVIIIIMIEINNSTTHGFIYRVHRANVDRTASFSGFARAGGRRRGESYRDKVGRESTTSLPPRDGVIDSEKKTM